MYRFTTQIKIYDKTNHYDIQLQIKLRKSRAEMFVQTKKDCKNVIMISV